MDPLIPPPRPAGPAVRRVWRVTFDHDRVARSSHVSPLLVDVMAPPSQHAQAVALRVHRFVRHRTGRREFEVDVRIDAVSGTGSLTVDRGRIATATIALEGPS